MNLSQVFYRNAAAKTRNVVNQGGTSCFAPEQLVIAKRGAVPISELTTDDFVSTEKCGELVWRKVKNVFRYSNTKPTVRIKLKSGETITVTDDHKFMFNGRWHTIKEILSLWSNGNMETNSRV